MDNNGGGNMTDCEISNSCPYDKASCVFGCGIEFDTTSLSQSDIEQIIAEKEPGDESEL